MGCAASQTTAVEAIQSSQPQSGQQNKAQDVPFRPPKEVKPPIAFEVPAAEEAESQENGANSIIKAHPPKRFRRLEDEQVPIVTQEEILRRQAEAERRRNEILQVRVQSARMATAKTARRMKPSSLLMVSEEA